MKIAKNTVVAIQYKLSDAQGNLIEESDEPMVYLHGGYDGTFPKIEQALEGRKIGFETQLQLEPEDAFGEYDADLVKVESRQRFPEPLEIGMQFEGIPDSFDEDDIFDDDANSDKADDSNLGALRKKDDNENNEDYVSDDDYQDYEDEDALIYTVTDIADDKIVLDGNHPLAGTALCFWLKVTQVRVATEDEIGHGHAHGLTGLDIDGSLDEDTRHTLH